MRAAWPDIGRVELAGLLAALAAAVLLAWLSAARPADMPVWAPWDFSWTQFLAAVLALGWYARGVALADAGAAPNVWRQASFVLGVVSIYAVLLTHFEYMAQHMFFLNRLQHMVMHHVGPFLVALSWPGETLYRGMPAPLRRVFDHRALRRVMRIVQQPALAGVLFAGLICLWLVPAVHFRAMIDHRLYDVMNWSMVIDGLLFWFLVLDPRPAPAARTSFAVRMIVTVAVMFPQIIAGSALTFSTRTLYSYYDLCGRLYPSLGALVDQHLGGAIVWIPSAMMSSIAFMLILNNIRLNEEREAAEEPDVDDAKNVVFASRWTGR
jgi:putative membrane protein